MKELFCSNCGKKREKGRRMCRPCYLEHKKQYAKDRYKKQGRYTYTNICVACFEEFNAFRKEQELCSKCYKLSLSHTNGENPYLMTKKGRGQHRVLSEKILNRKLNSQEVVHHLDNNPKNNNLDNLIILSRKQHGKLHKYLRKQRVIIEKSMNENWENCWNTLIIPMTTTWLEMANVKVIKLWEIGQSAAEPLSSKEYEEGSETT